MHSKTLTTKLDYINDTRVMCKITLDYSDPDIEAKCRTTHSDASELYDGLAKGYNQLSYAIEYIKNDTLP